MDTKKLLIPLMFLVVFVGCSAAVDVDIVLNVSTHNDTVTISDSKGFSQTYNCGADQSLLFRGKQSYDVRADDIKPYLSNTTCSVADFECKMPEARIVALQAAIIEASNTNMGTTKTELLNQLPALVIASANLTSLDTCIGQYGMCQADYSVCLNENDAYKSNNTIYLVASLICLFLAAVLFLNNEYGFIEKLKQKQREGGGGGQ